MSGNYFSQLARVTGIVVEETALSKGDAMKPRTPEVQRVEGRSLSSEPESMKKAYELYEQRGREAERDVEDWLKAEELVRKEMNARRPSP